MLTQEVIPNSFITPWNPCSSVVELLFLGLSSPGVNLGNAARRNHDVDGHLRGVAGAHVNFGWESGGWGVVRSDDDGNGNFAREVAGLDLDRLIH